MVCDVAQHLDVVRYVKDVYVLRRVGCLGGVMPIHEAEYGCQPNVVNLQRINS